MDLSVEKYQKLIYQIAWSFNRTTGLPIDDLISEGYVAYCKAIKQYEPENSAFSTFLHSVVSNHLKMYIAKLNKDIDTSDYPVEEFDGEITVEDRVAFNEQISTLSADARMVCKMIFESPQDYIVSNSPWLSRGVVRKQLSNFGWGQDRIWSCFNEIKSIL